MVATGGRGTFEKVSDVHCLYRFSTNGVYYALTKQKGKQVRRSLETTDKATAKRKLADLQQDLGKVDAPQGKLTLRSFCDRYLYHRQPLAEDDHHQESGRRSDVIRQRSRCEHAGFQNQAFRHPTLDCVLHSRRSPCGDTQASKHSRP